MRPFYGNGVGKFVTQVILNGFHANFLSCYVFMPNNRFTSPSYKHFTYSTHSYPQKIESQSTIAKKAWKYVKRTCRNGRKKQFYHDFVDVSVLHGLVYSRTLKFVCDCDCTSESHCIARLFHKKTWKVSHGGLVEASPVSRETRRPSCKSRQMD